MTHSKTTQKTIEDHKKMSDEDLLTMYASEEGQDFSKRNSTCPGCTTTKNCQCKDEGKKRS